MRSSRDSGARRIALSALLVSLMLILGYVESLFPLSFGVPGIKLGLSNSVLIFAVFLLDLPTAYCLMSLKVLLSGLLFSGLSAMLYAFFGGLLSLTGMLLLHRFTRLSPLPVSTLGGVLHNTGQLLLAAAVLRTPGLLGYLSALLPAGAVCGALTGVCARAVMRALPAGLLPPAPVSSKKRTGALLLLSLLLFCVILFLCRSAFAPQHATVTIVRR